MYTVQDVFDAIRELPTVSEQGTAFEKLMVNYFQLHPVLRTEYDYVARFSDWNIAKPGSNQSLKDLGIDLVARRREDQTWTAIQCKFYSPSRRLSKEDINSFFTESGRQFYNEDGELESFTNRIIIATTDNWSDNARDTLKKQTVPVQTFGLPDIADAPLDWDIVYPNSESRQQLEFQLHPRKHFEPRPHQRTAIDKALVGFATHDRGKLVMACGTGKTFTSLKLAEEYTEKHSATPGRSRILFCVPSISLLSQTLREWSANSKLDLMPIAVCSDKKVSKQTEDIQSYELEIPVSTDPATIAEKLSQRKRAEGMKVVFSTYQSLEAIHQAQKLGAEPFDLIICDEAHRTTGVTMPGDDHSAFVAIHDANYIRGGKRLYMTATPRLYDDKTKDRAADRSAEVASMDDEAIFGPEFHRLGFGEAVDKGLLTDYKVLVLTVDESVAAEALQRSVATVDNELNLDTASRLIGAWNAMAKRSGSFQDKKDGFESADAPMERVVAFARDIASSKQVAEQFPALINAHTELMAERSAMSPHIDLHNADLKVAVEHVDGTMNAQNRGEKLTWLKAPVPDMETRVLSNARCLSEGVDVPALDAVLFLNPRNSVVDVVQSVGRVMRKSDGKDYGYIILPVGVPAGVSPSAALADNKRFHVVWQVLNALRAHDDRFNAMVNSAQLNALAKDRDPSLSEPPPRGQLGPSRIQSSASSPLGDRIQLDTIQRIDTVAGTSEGLPLEFGQLALFALEEWQEAMYVRIVDKVGTRTYWEDWADDVAGIAERQITRIKALLADADENLTTEFDAFVDGLRGNLNAAISDDDAIAMLSQHLITAPVFNALFDNYDFITHNPVAQVMQRMVDVLSDSNLESETEQLETFYQSVRVRASEVTSASGKQQVIKELYERFFRKAFKKQAESLGIVYTPVEIVDFILRAADEVSRMHFGKGLSDEGVCILDPFAGTSTFTVRLLQSGLIKPEDLARKYASELFATEIMLLAYYVSAVNIETTYNALRAEAAQRNDEDAPEYETFTGIALADTFQIHEEGDIPDLEIFQSNNAAIDRQMAAPINVVIGNPPYSVGQTSANDLNANLKYPSLDARIAETYAGRSTATNKNSLYDSYLRAFRWATDRIGDQGVVAFVSNGGWLDANTGDGVRLSVAEDFTDFYVFNLRGNARTAGEQRRKEAGNVFRDGGRTTIAVMIGIKDLSSSEFKLHYRDIGDYLTAEEKLKIVNQSTIENTDWTEITPNTHGDWLSQRDDAFATWPVIGNKKTSDLKFFKTFSAGLKTGRDAWAYAPSPKAVLRKVEKLTHTYNSATNELQAWLVDKGITHPKEADVTIFLRDTPAFADNKTISWNRTLKNLSARNRKISPHKDRIFESLYRPFTKASGYFDSSLNDMTYQLPRMFPTPEHSNIGFVCVGTGESVETAVLGTTLLPDLHVIATSQFFPRFTWEKADADEGELFGAVVVDKQNAETSVHGEIGEVLDGYVRVDNITPEIKALYREALGQDISGDDIFHFVYGKLHDPEYRTKYAADLKKMLPHIETPETRAEFDKFAKAGAELMALHVGYEDVEPWPLDLDWKPTADLDDRETWRVTKMKWAKKKDPKTGKNVNDVTTLIYNPKLTIRGIPAEADQYMLGSRSAVAWLIDRYQVKRDKASGIVNDPNDWADEVGNPKYIVELIGKVTRVAMETVRIVEGLGVNESPIEEEQLG